LQTDLLSISRGISATARPVGGVQAICDFVHRRIEFGYPHARNTRTAWEGYREGRGVCRDYAHLAVAFCRCMNIPARYCTGYLGDMGTEPPYGPMDFAGWFEAFLGDRWYTFDARNNTPRIGRVLIARGRDACDVALSSTFGPNTLTVQVGPTKAVAERLGSRLLKVVWVCDASLRRRQATRGLIFASDSRTHAGVDNYAKFCKMTVFERAGDRVLVLLSSGGLAATQAVINVLRKRAAAEPPHIWSASSMFDVANLVSDSMRAIERRDGPFLEASDLKFNASFILGGQIAGEDMRLFRIYAEGNFIEADTDTCFLQTGEAKYGKPILDLAVTEATLKTPPRRAGVVRPTMLSNLRRAC
jgi:putative proteasome-type protease